MAVASPAARRLSWLPNALTIARVVALPVLAVVLLTADGPTSPTGAWLFAAIAVTDLLDGQLARRLGAESTFGRIVDPLADRLLLLVGLVGLIALGRFHPSGPAILIGRDLLSVGGFLWLRRMGDDPRVDLAGKASSALAMVATALALLSGARAVDALFWAAVAFAVLTLANYARAVLGRHRPR